MQHTLIAFKKVFIVRVVSNQPPNQETNSNHRHQFSISSALSAAVAADDEGAVRVLAAALAGAGVLDAGGADAAALAGAGPEEGPAVVVDVGHVAAGGGGAAVGAARAVGRALDAVVLVVGLEDGKGLRRGARVVGALGGLDGGGRLGCCGHC